MEESRLKLVRVRDPRRSLLLAILYQLVFFSQGISQVDTLHEDMDVTLVSVYVSAMDSKGKFVTNLRPEEIVLTEDGELQTISEFRLGEKDLPLTVSLLVDNSASFGAKDLDLAKNAGLLLLKEMKPHDKMLLITFRQSPSIAVEPTFEKDKIERALHSIQPQYGNTALFDSISLAAQVLQEELGRKYLILFSDGQDNVSQRSYKDLLSRIQGLSNVSIISIGTVLSKKASRFLGAKQEYEKGKKALIQLADSSGGFSYFPSKISDLHDMVKQFREALESQYFLAYTPSNRKKDGSWREIDLRCLRPGITLIYPKGYFAAK